MRLFATLLLVVGAAPTRAETPVSRCWAACERNVVDARQRASACGACLTSPDRADAWVARLPEAPATLLDDADWEVRWAGVLAAARKAKSTGPQELAAWIARARNDELLRACVTAVHAAGATKQPLTTWLAPKANERCAPLGKDVEAAVWIELYGESAPLRSEALRHLSLAFARPPARVVLDALPTHPPAFDALVLEQLEHWARERDVSPTAELLRAATPADVPTMNRVLALYSRRRDEAGPKVTSPDVETRREAITTLAPLAPLSEKELQQGLADPLPAHRLKAARALARGESRTLAEAVAARWSGEKPATEAELTVFFELLGDVHEVGCAEMALKAWHPALPLLVQRGEGPPRSDALRALALRTAASCDFAAASPEIQAALASKAPADRAAAIAAQGFAPTTQQLAEQLTLALTDAEPRVRSAACSALAQHRWRPGVARIAPLTNDPNADVRAGALRALVALDAAGIEGKLAQALETDSAAEVRLAAVGLLARFSGPRTRSALERAARIDSSADVKLVAAQTLRRLAPGSFSP